MAALFAVGSWGHVSSQVKEGIPVADQTGMACGIGKEFISPADICGHAGGTCCFERFRHFIRSPHDRHQCCDYCIPVVGQMCCPQNPKTPLINSLCFLFNILLLLFCILLHFLLLLYLWKAFLIIKEALVLFLIFFFLQQLFHHLLQSSSLNLEEGRNEALLHFQQVYYC